MSVRGNTGGGADATAAIQGGDAWQALVERYATLVDGICRVHALSVADAEEVHTTVWLRLAERLPRLRRPEAVGAWLAATTRLQCLEALAPRGECNRAGVTEAPGIECRDAAIAAALAALDPVERHVLRLRAIVPRPTDVEVGAALALSAAEVLAAERRGVARLRAWTTRGTVWHVEVRALGSARDEGARDGIGASLEAHGR